MYEYPRYRPSVGFLSIVVVSILLAVDPKKDLLYVLLMFIQMTALYLTIYVEYSTHNVMKKYFFLHVDIFQQCIMDIDLLKEQRLTPIILLNRYRWVFDMFESSIQTQYRRVYKKHTTKFEFIRNEINRLDGKTDLEYSDLHHLKLSIKTLIG